VGGPVVAVDAIHLARGGFVDLVLAGRIVLGEKVGDVAFTVLQPHPGNDLALLVGGEIEILLAMFMCQ